MIHPDGSGFRELTTGPNNNGFPSMSPNGKRVVYRTFGPAARVAHHEHRDKAVTTLPTAMTTSRSGRRAAI